MSDFFEKHPILSFLIFIFVALFIVTILTSGNEIHLPDECLISGDRYDKECLAGLGFYVSGGGMPIAP